MTVASTSNKAQYTVTSGQTVFPYTFPIYADADLQVIETDVSTGVDTVKTLTADYTVSGAGGTVGGNVTFGTAPAAGRRITILRELALTQGAEYTPNDPFPAKTHERALDRLTYLAQQLQEQVDRSLKLPVSTVATATSDALMSAITASVTAAQAAQTSAEAAKTSAQAAQTSAEAAKTSAEAAKTSAEAARDTALLAQLPVGSIIDYPSETPPSGWLIRDGSSLSMTTYSALYAAFGRAIFGKATGAVMTAVAATDVLSTTAHGLSVGHLVEFTTTGTLPGGLAVNTTYYVVEVIDTVNYKVSATPGGAAVDITSTGSGTHRVCKFYSLPDDRGRFTRAWANGSANDPDRASRTDRGDGTTGDHVGTLQADAYRSHQHQKNSTDAGAALTAGGYGSFVQASAGFLTGAAGANETRPLNRAYLPIIKY